MNWHKNAKKKRPTKPGQIETRKLGSPGESPETSPTKGGLGSRRKLSQVEPLSSDQTANIVASVDIPEEKPPSNPDILKCYNIGCVIQFLSPHTKLASSLFQIPH